MLIVKKQKVYVGLSGGVDSSVSALLLKEQGYEVLGVFIKGWQPDWIPCTWKIDRVSAMRTAAYLEIPFITLDLEQQYKDKVVKYLLDEYSKGNTPNPDMLCNREIKFGSFLNWCLKNGADFVATGHYAVIPPLPKGDQGDFKMLESADKEKDQSYFLSQLTQKELSKTLFPIGHLQKSEVRKIALENKLPVATRKDSQGICFVGDLEMKDFLKRELKPRIGKVLNLNGEIVGEHDGAILYTIGERHGFRVKTTSAGIKNMYVVSKDLEKNVIVVGDINAKTQKEIKIEIRNNSNYQIVDVKNLSFTYGFASLDMADVLSIRVRYRGEKHKVDIVNYDDKSNVLTLEYRLKNEEPLVFAPGQFAVFYDGEICLGGGELI